MIQTLTIKGFKNINEEILRLKPLTILTGLNSTGKSSLFQAILLLNKETTRNGSRHLDNIISSFDSLRNIYQNTKQISLRLETEEKAVEYHLTVDGYSAPEDCAGLEFEKNLYYLSANRIGPENDAAISQDIFCGTDGRFLFGTYEKEKSVRLKEQLIKDTKSLTLAAQVNYWMGYILNMRMELNTEKRTAQKVEVNYKSDGIPGLLPSQLGAGVSYLAKILILCLRTKPGDVILIENPEIHLHPAAQARLGEFFTFIVQAGVQLIIETHCEHLINKLRYEVYKRKFNPEEIVLYYKAGITKPFLKITIDKKGQFSSEFPEGFFDATLAELLELG